MAIWQFDIALVPEAALSADPDLLAHSLTPDGVDSSSWWSATSVSSEVEKRLDAILPKGESWHDELSVWGVEDGHRIDLWKNGDEIESLNLRIDVRNTAPSFVEEICSLATSLECKFYGYESHSQIEPLLVDLLRTIRESDAAKFVENPRGFLSEIAAQDES